MSKNGSLAFALGGLAGNNAHGAGFLQAALERRVDPLMVSCTSGQILWLWRYLRERRAARQALPGLREELARDIAQISAFHNKNLDWLALALQGKPGIYRPAGDLYLADLWRNTAQALARLYQDKGNAFLLRRFLELFPCRQLLLDFPDSFFEQISADLAGETDIGIVFNSYSPTYGCEYVYLNERAMDLLNENADRAMRSYQPGQASNYRDRTYYRAITPQGVRDALWLYQYGFDGQAEARVDGAYFRDLILCELTPAHTIFVVRPVHYQWSGELPRDVLQMEDFKTKIGFNGAYAGERYQIRLVNMLLEHGKLDAQARRRYHPIELREIELERGRSFFDYVFEDMGVFDDAYRSAIDHFGGDKVAVARLAHRANGTGAPRAARAGASAR